MKLKSTTLPTVFYPLLVVLLLALTVVQANGRVPLAQGGDPWGSTTTCDGTPFEEPELTPQGPRNPKDPGAHRIEGGEPVLSSASTVQEPSTRHEVGRLYSSLFVCLSWIRF